MNWDKFSKRIIGGLMVALGVTMMFALIFVAINRME